MVANTSTVSAHYTDLVSLAARQTLSALDITVSTGSDGNPNASDVRIFMKDIGFGTTGYASIPFDHSQILHHPLTSTMQTCQPRRADVRCHARVSLLQRIASRTYARSSSRCPRQPGSLAVICCTRSWYVITCCLSIIRQYLIATTTGLAYPNATGIRGAHRQGIECTQILLQS